MDRQDNLIHLTMQQLEVLVSLAGEGTFSRAARRMNLSQPSLTKHIQNIEAMISAPVVTRGRTGVMLTPEGKILRDFARKVFKSRAEAADHIRRLQETGIGDISVAASSIPAGYILPCRLGDFRKRHPGIFVRVQSADSQDVLDMVEDGEKEIGFVGKMPGQGRLAAEPVWDDRLVLVVPASHAWAGQRAISVETLLKEPFIAREKGSGTQTALERYLKNKINGDLSEWEVVAELGSSEAVKEAVLGGLGVSILSIHAVRRELERGLLRMVGVEDWLIERSFYLVYRRHAAFLRHHQIFLDFIRQDRSRLASVLTS